MIELKEHYPIGLFPSVWENVEGLIKKGRLTSCWQVLEEVRRGDDELVAWCENRKDVLLNMDRHINQVHEIIGKHPKLVNPNAKPDTADPYLIALAMSYKPLGYNPVIVTEENQQQSHIPHVAKKHGVESCGLMEMFQNEEWEM